ncbi:MAG: guanine deaminase [Myxococcota bacterium]
MTTLRCRLLTPVSASEVRWIPDAVVVLDGSVLAEVGPWDGRPVDEDLRPWVLVPGFVDAHVHFPQTRIVGAASGPLLEWLARSTFPEEQRFAHASHAQRVASVFCERLAAAGTTLSMVYGSVHPGAAEVLFGQLEASGLRAIAGPVLMDANSPEPLILPPDRALPALEGLADRWDGADDGRLRVAVIPRFALSCTREMLEGAGRLAQDRGLWVSTHLSENLEECRVAREMFSAADYLSIYEDAGLLHDRSVYAHCIHLSDSEWSRFADAGAVVAHCPDSNDFLGSGGMPTRTVMERGIPLAIGTDVAAGRSFRVPRILSSAYDNALRQGLQLDPRQLLWWGTRGGALALGEARVGLLEAGREADLVALDVPEWAETEEEVLGWALFDHDATVRRTWVRGRTVYARA